METSVTIVGIVISLLIALPLYFVMRTKKADKERINKIIAVQSQNNHYNFSFREVQNKKVLAIDEIKKGFLLIDLNKTNEKTWLVDLKETKLCKLIVTNEDKSNTILKIEFLFQNKLETSTEILIPVYEIEDDQIGQVQLFEDHELAKKWLKIIQDCIVRKNIY